MDWTVCTLQVMWQLEQKNKVQSYLMSNNEFMWRKLFGQWVLPRHWIKAYSQFVQCYDRWCKFLILPILFLSQGSPEYWLPEFQGKYIGNNNKTYDLDLCETTSDGILCGQQS